jgi:predicted RNase H-like nuclease (RuvC/YqgF family)
MRKVLGLLTEDFRLYHDLVAALKARDLPFVSLSFSRRIPETVGAVLTSPVEARRIRNGHVVAVDDIDSSIAKALQILKGKVSWSELLVGVDPGREPGVAIIGDGDVIDARTAASPAMGTRRTATAS